MTTVMLALVGDQPMPNIIAALQYQPRPERLELLVTGEEYQQIADNIAKVLKGRMTCCCCQTKVKPFEVADVQSVCRQIVEKCQKADEDLVFNLTGGTKTMAMAAYDVARELGKPALYVETANQKIIHLLPAHRPEQDILVRELRVKHYLQAHGVEIQQEGGRPADRTSYALTLPRPLREAADYLAREADSVYRLLDMARHRANHEMQKEPSAPDVLTGCWKRKSLLDYLHKADDLSPRTEAELHEFLALLRSQRYQVLDEFEVKSNGDMYVRMTEEQRQFITGRWLEYYTFHQLDSNYFDDRRVSLKVNWTDNKWRILEQVEDVDELMEGLRPGTAGTDEQPGNELDVVALRGPVLTICSCKTGQVDDSTQQSRGKEAIYELETIARSVGLYCRKVLVVSRPDFESGGDISRGLISKNFIKRSLILGIAPVTARDLTGIGEIMANPARHLEHWKERL